MKITGFRLRDNIFSFGGWYLLILLISLTILFFTSCKQTSEPELLVKSGVVTVFGNEPFTEIGIKTFLNDNYVILSNYKIKRELYNYQGLMCNVFYEYDVCEYGINYLVAKKIIIFKNGVQLIIEL